MGKLVMGTGPTIKDVEEFLEAVFIKQKIELFRINFIARQPLCGDMTHILAALEVKIPISSEVELNDNHEDIYPEFP